MSSFEGDRKVGKRNYAELGSDYLRSRESRGLLGELGSLPQKSGIEYDKLTRNSLNDKNFNKPLTPTRESLLVGKGISRDIGQTALSASMARVWFSVGIPAEERVTLEDAQEAAKMVNRLVPPTDRFPIPVEAVAVVQSSADMTVQPYNTHRRSTQIMPTLFGEQPSEKIIGDTDSTQYVFERGLAFDDPSQALKDMLGYLAQRPASSE